MDWGRPVARLNPQTPCHNRVRRLRCRRCLWLLRRLLRYFFERLILTSKDPRRYQERPGVSAPAFHLDVGYAVGLLSAGGHISGCVRKPDTQNGHGRHTDHGDQGGHEPEFDRPDDSRLWNEF